MMECCQVVCVQFLMILQMEQIDMNSALYCVYISSDSCPDDHTCSGECE